jgi:hypothetical protein
MASEIVANVPRKKRNILWLIAGLFLLLLGVFFFQLLGPDPRIIISPQTTYLTEPLAPNGLPDYECYVLERYREGVTRENNAAALIWKALWPGELSRGDYAAVAKELGLSQIPSQQEAVEPIWGKVNQKRVADWLMQLADPATAGNSAASFRSTPPDGSLDLDDDPSMQSNLERATEEVVDQASSRPWTSQQIPPLAEWVRDNNEPLDTLLEASRLPRCYFPSTTLIDREPGTLIGMLLSGPQGARQAARSLPVRAMWHLGENRPDEAWQDLLAVHRIGRLVTQGHTLVEQLVGSAIDGVACYSTQTLIHHGKLSAEQLQQIRRDLAALPPFNGSARAINEGERLGTIDALIHLSVMNDTSWNETLGITGNDAGGLPILQVVSVDWNLVLRDVNRWYDRLAAAARLPTRAERMTGIQTVEADMLALVAESQRPVKIALSAVSRRQRSEVVAAIMLGLFLPALDAAIAAEDRANATMQLTQLAAALADYRAAHGAYPEVLEHLAPGVLDKLPVDIHTASPYVYKRDGEGYLLYSRGDNGTDDGGSNEQTNTLAGQSLGDLDEAETQNLQSKIPPGADDISIRLPHATLELPSLPPPANAP